MFMGCVALRHASAEAPLAGLDREPDDIAGIVPFLAGPDGGWGKGQILRANGGAA